jgi:hypothetical protein
MAQVLVRPLTKAEREACLRYLSERSREAVEAEERRKAENAARWERKVALGLRAKR